MRIATIMQRIVVIRDVSIVADILFVKIKDATTFYS